MNKIFDKKFLYVIADEASEALTGKMVIASDNLSYLITTINTGKLMPHETISTGGYYATICVYGELEKVHIQDRPFMFPFAVITDGTSSRYSHIYYDPNYEYKVAYSQGKHIEFQMPDGSWAPATVPSWDPDKKYRIAELHTEKWFISAFEEYLHERHPLSALIKWVLEAIASVEDSAEQFSCGCRIVCWCFGAENYFNESETAELICAIHDRFNFWRYE